ncbi:hypothetical protein [Virgibacillus proomii]|uniref:hypothetical protein n=1 Tax=Virgibacillus proomii TaxID=84407 RepID=UPI001C1123B9|nr:hypothetical protein [Virgibacillus proomii]MBU5267312.1 hypothetical protein [Virgibacillus proomii]
MMEMLVVTAIIFLYSTHQVLRVKKDGELMSENKQIALPLYITSIFILLLVNYLYFSL